MAEDLQRGRVYLPLEDLDAFGVREADLGRRGLTPALRELLAFEVGRARGHYRLAAKGVDLLAPPRGRASGRPASCTAGSSSGSRPPVTTSSGPGSPCRDTASWRSSRGTCSRRPRRTGPSAG
ncbi:squalene/phytoene synthase family protein [Streptosporangium lutulentum]